MHMGSLQHVRFNGDRVRPETHLSVQLAGRCSEGGVLGIRERSSSYELNPSVAVAALSFAQPDCLSVLIFPTGISCWLERGAEP